MKYLLYLSLLISLVLTSCSEASDSTGAIGGFDEGSTGDGTNGSYTAMIAVADRLYYVDNTTLFTSDISDPTSIQVIDQQEVGTEIETLFHRAGLLFIGSGPALYIYELDDDRIPRRASETRYNQFGEDMTPCDPVVADAGYAYVTLSSTAVTEQGAGGCPRFTLVNELRIYDITDIESPMLISTTDLTNPKGLALDGDVLFVCDSEAGLKVYDVSDRLHPELLHSFTDGTTFDAIARAGLLVVAGPSAIMEYDYSDLSDMELIGTFGI